MEEQPPDAATMVAAQLRIKRMWTAFLWRRNCMFNSGLRRLHALDEVKGTSCNTANLLGFLGDDDSSKLITKLTQMEAVVTSYLQERDAYRRYQAQHRATLRFRGEIGSQSAGSVDFPPFSLRITNEDECLLAIVSAIRQSEAPCYGHGRSPALLTPSRLPGIVRIVDTSASMDATSSSRGDLRCASTSVSARSPSLYYVDNDTRGLSSSDTYPAVSDHIAELLDVGGSFMVGNESTTAISTRVGNTPILATHYSSGKNPSSHTGGVIPPPVLVGKSPLVQAALRGVWVNLPFAYSVARRELNSQLLSIDIDGSQGRSNGSNTNASSFDIADSKEKGSSDSIKSSLEVNGDENNEEPAAGRAAPPFIETEDPLTPLPSDLITTAQPSECGDQEERAMSRERNNSDTDTIMVPSLIPCSSLARSLSDQPACLNTDILQQEMVQLNVEKDVAPLQSGSSSSNDPCSSEGLVLMVTAPSPEHAAQKSSTSPMHQLEQTSKPGEIPPTPPKQANGNKANDDETCMSDTPITISVVTTSSTVVANVENNAPSSHDDGRECSKQECVTDVSHATTKKGSPVRGNGRSANGGNDDSPVDRQSPKHSPRNSMSSYAKRHVHIKPFSSYGALSDVAHNERFRSPSSASEGDEKPQRSGGSASSSPSRTGKPRPRSVESADVTSGLRERLELQRKRLLADPKLTTSVDQHASMRGTLRRRLANAVVTQLDGDPPSRPGSAMSSSAILEHPSNSPVHVVTRAFTPTDVWSKGKPTTVPVRNVPPLLRSRKAERLRNMTPSSQLDDERREWFTQQQHHQHGLHSQLYGSQQAGLEAVHQQSHLRKLRTALIPPCDAWKRKHAVHMSKERSGFENSRSVVERINSQVPMTNANHPGRFGVDPNGGRCLPKAAQTLSTVKIPTSLLVGVSLASVQDIEYLKALHATIFQ